MAGESSGMSGFGSPWAQGISIGGQVLNAIGNAYAAKAQAQAIKYQYESAALRAQFNVDMNKLNAQIAAQESTRKQIAFTQQSALQGFQAAQRMANTRVQQSHSGVRMDSTSSQQVRASEKFSRAVDMATTEQNRIELLNQGQQQVTNYLAQATIAQGDVNANNALGAAINPSKNFTQSLITGLYQVAQENAPFFISMNEVDDVQLTDPGSASKKGNIDLVSNYDNGSSMFGNGGTSGLFNNSMGI